MRIYDRNLSLNTLYYIITRYNLHDLISRLLTAAGPESENRCGGSAVFEKSRLFRAKNHGRTQLYATINRRKHCTKMVPFLLYEMSRSNKIYVRIPGLITIIIGRLFSNLFEN